MIIKVADLQAGSMPLDFSESFSVPKAYSVAGDVTAFVKGAVMKNDNLVTLDARLTADVALSCGLCLAPVECRLDFSVNETFTDSPATNDAFWDFNGIIIDITPALLSNLLLNLPMKALCREDCKGLCPVCGKDRNFTDCNCNTSEIDPRWQALFEKEV